jgi:hypothetical protein
MGRPLLIAGESFVVTGAASRRWTDRALYTGMSLAAVATVFVGFARTYFIRSQFQTTPLPPYLHVHGLVFTTWIALFVAQTTLIAVRRTDIHRRLGWVGASLAAVMVVAALTAAVLSGRRDVAAGHEDVALTFLATPLLSMLVFVLLIAAAVYHRRSAETHKRLACLCAPPDWLTACRGSRSWWTTDGRVRPGSTPRVHSLAI